MADRSKKRRRRGTGENTGKTSAATGEPTGAEARDSIGATGAGTGDELLVAPGVFQMSEGSNRVEIDPAGLEAEAAAALAGASSSDVSGDTTSAAEASGDSTPGPQQLLEGYRIIALALVDRGGAVIAPAWQIVPPRKAHLADAIAQAALLWFGDMPIPPKYLALLVVADAVMQIADDNRDPQTGALKPLRVVQQKPPAAAAAARPAA